MLEWKHPYLVIDCHFFLVTVGCLNEEYQSEFSAKNNATFTATITSSHLRIDLKVLEHSGLGIILGATYDRG